MKIHQLNPDDLEDARTLVDIVFKSAQEYPPPVAVGALLSVIAKVYRLCPPKSGSSPFITMCAMALDQLLDDCKEADLD